MMIIMMFFVAWLFEMPVWGYVALMLLGFIFDVGYRTIREIIEDFFKKIKNGG